ncbi:5-oxoprolinase subunit PxpB [Brevibacillus sp. H7]|jgi:inhibitor of KinA|uniref:5-oxoprolinase subunit PxpB n=1 Tax=Brevibacillus sp. H7 TaxID=3349138 RepID=UPI0037FE30DC
MPLQLLPLGDQAVLVQFGTAIQTETHERVKQLSAYLEKHPLPGMVEYIPAYTTVAVFYDAVQVYEQQKWNTTAGEILPAFEWVCRRIREIVSHLGSSVASEGRIVEIPVCYGKEMGPDLGDVARHHGISEEEVISIHAGGEYLVYMIGFAPGFPYIGGMSPKIATPRRTSPRLKIPAGSVGIAGQQTGIYPMETPGGWQIIGRTPLKLFLPQQDPPSLLRAGDQVRFVPITLEEYFAYEEGRG